MFTYTAFHTVFSTGDFMFILEPQSVPTKENFKVQNQSNQVFRVTSSKAMENTFLSEQYSFDEMVRLRALFLGLVKQKRWIYFLNDKIQLKANHLPVLQVKLKQHHTQFDCIARIVASGHCSAIVIERSNMDDAQLQEIQITCIKQKVQLVLLENLQDSDTLH